MECRAAVHSGKSHEFTDGIGNQRCLQRPESQHHGRETIGHGHGKVAQGNRKTAGTWTGAAASSLLSPDVAGACGVAMYGMFIAILIPKARQDHSVAVCIGT